MALKIQLRRGTASEWTSANPVLMQGEMGVETDTLKVKLGDGTTAWSSLQYFTQGVKGDTGATGATGATGPRGLKGDVGDTGPANTLTVGTVTTGAAGSSAVVTIAGTAPNQTISFTIPKGDQGIQGIQGVKGDQGEGVPAGGTTGYVVQKTVSGTAWVDPTLDFLSDVAITSPSNGQSLVYESATSTWKNATPATTLDGLTDVTVASPADKQVLQYEAATSQWKNKAATGGVTVSATAPASPIAGDAWFDSNDGLLYVYFNDGNSSQWVEVKANSAQNADLVSRVATVETRATALEAKNPGTTGQPLVSAAGIATSTTVNGNLSAPIYWDGATTITLPAGRFTQPPVVTATMEMGSSVSWCGLTVTPSTTSFIVRGMRVGSYPSALPIHWSAVQMTSSSGVG